MNRSLVFSFLKLKYKLYIDFFLLYSGCPNPKGFHTAACSQQYILAKAKDAHGILGRLTRMMRPSQKYLLTGSWHVKKSGPQTPRGLANQRKSSLWSREPYSSYKKVFQKETKKDSYQKNSINLKNDYFDGYDEYNFYSNFNTFLTVMRRWWNCDSLCLLPLNILV